MQCARAGTSSFGMSGVNAHLLLAPSRTPAHSLSGGVGLQWRRGRYWPSPFPHRIGRPDTSGRRGILRYPYQCIAGSPKGSGLKPLSA